MTRRRWIADEFAAGHAVLTGAHAAHLSRILRARVGQQFEVACRERVHIATVASVADDRVEFSLGAEVAASAALPITLLLAIFKFDRMEWAIEKCTELNVTRIVPVIARRTEKNLAVAAEKRVERWRRIAREASEQSRRAMPPEIADPVKLKEALAEHPTPSIVIPSAVSATALASRGTCIASSSPGEGLDVRPPYIAPMSADLRIVLAETEHELSLGDVLRAREHIEFLTLAIGPEGGWTAEELQSFTVSQWTAASLGDTILRAETAAVAALAIARAV